MNRRIAEMESRLAALEPVQLEITDESHKHAGHAGAREGGGHFVVYIVSARFNGKTTPIRHRMVYSALGEMMKRDIHALTLKTVSAEEC